MEELKILVKELTSIPGIPSFEHKVRNYILKKLKNTKAEIEVNTLGSVIAKFAGKSNSKPSLLVDAHMDEVGFIVQYIEPNGCLRFAAMGNIDQRVVTNQHVIVHSTTGVEYPGVIGILPPHVAGKKDVNVAYAIDELMIDCGFFSDKEAKDAGIRQGVQVTFEYYFKELANGLFSAKAIDDRTGCAVLLSVAQELNKKQPERDVYLSFSVQEEGGCYGISSVVTRINPENALVVECTTSCDTASGVSEYKKVSFVNRGVAFTTSDTSVNILPEIVDEMIKIAESHKIKYQMKTPKFGGSNAAKLHMAGTGVKVGIASLPARYLHSSVSVASWDDLNALFEFVRTYVYYIS